MEELFAGDLRREWRSSAAYQGGPVRFGENIRRPAPFGREMPANTYASSERRRCRHMALVSLVFEKTRHTAQTYRVSAGKSQAELSGIANVYSCCVPTA